MTREPQQNPVLVFSITRAGRLRLGLGRLKLTRSIVLLLFLQKQKLATVIYLFGLGTLLLSGPAEIQPVDRLVDL
jgi:hypothetical protein